MNIGDLYFTVRGIAEIQDFYEENEIEKVRFHLHSVDKNDGVTATGDAILMSTTPEILDSWIKDFPRDLAERRNSLAAKNLKDILYRIDQAKFQGPQVKVPRATR